MWIEQLESCRRLCYVLNLNGKGEHENICFDSDGLPACCISVCEDDDLACRSRNAQPGPEMPYPSRLRKKYRPGVLNRWIIFGKDGLVDAGVWLATINLPPRSLPLIEWVELVGQEYVRVE